MKTAPIRLLDPCRRVQSAPETQQSACWLARSKSGKQTTISVGRMNLLAS